jgi:enoyl-CoA hydratase/carnithine racemase
MSNPAPSAGPSHQDLWVEREGEVLWLTINREERRNAMSPAVLAGMSEQITAAQTDRSLRAIVITGTGTKAFCAGADLQTDKTFVQDYSEPYGRMANLLRLARQSNVPLIARVNGACMAGGFALLSMCDLAVAASHAQFGRNVPHWGAHHRRAGAGIRPGQLRGRQRGRATDLAADTPARQVPCGTAARHVHDEEDRIDGL